MYGYACPNRPAVGGGGGGAAKTGGGKGVDAAGGVTVEYVLSSKIRKENLHTKTTNTDTVSYNANRNMIRHSNFPIRGEMGNK
jgi:hypothetical protein